MYLPPRLTENTSPVQVRSPENTSLLHAPLSLPTEFNTIPKLIPIIPRYSLIFLHTYVYVAKQCKIALTRLKLIQMLSYYVYLTVSKMHM